ncbi:Yaf2/RYBP C-terminal binding motif [Trinorchestia longiramus]|nr:Yaf2/RYBP C-terminal binding motif [Trinorchestia longiramus]
MWDCSVCTYRNSPEAFKCLMCDVRKGTSTRKPRLNAELVAAQVAQVVPPKPKKTERPNKERKYEGRISSKGRPRLKNVDRSTAEHNAVTVNNVTVIITEFQPKQKNSSPSSTTNMAASSSSAHPHHDTNSCDSIVSSSAGDSRVSASAAADTSAMSVDSEAPGNSESIA